MNIGTIFVGGRGKRINSKDRSKQFLLVNGLCATEHIYGVDGASVLIHDGVRPLIDSQTISDNIQLSKI